jgi:ubiquinone/menaquinone biosynthesis C-methylase UbiE
MAGTKIWDYWADKYERLWVQKYSLSPTRRDILKEIRKIIKPNESYNILDMGCGTGQLIREMQEEFKAYNIKYTGVDIASKMIEKAKEKDPNSNYLNCSVDEFSVDGEQFDIIICTHSFPYYPDKEVAMEKFHNLLKADGHLLLAQASANTAYDHIAMFFVKFTTSKARYLSIKRMQAIGEKYFKLLRVHKIKEKFYMPSICLFIYKKDGTKG